MGCTSSTATDEVDDTRAGDHGKVSKQYTHPPVQGRISVTSGGSINQNNGLNEFHHQSIPLPTTPEDTGSTFIARFAYQARTVEDLSFEKGEKLRVRTSI